MYNYIEEVIDDVLTPLIQQGPRRDLPADPYLRHHSYSRIRARRSIGNVGGEGVERYMRLGKFICAYMLQ